MKSNYFNQIIPKTHLYTLLNRICRIEQNTYILNYNSYKSGMFYDLISQFMQFCVPYYLKTKQIYATKEITYKSFLTVVRHICKTNHIPYTNKIKYNKSEYEIIYYITILQDNEVISEEVVVPPVTQNTSITPSTQDEKLNAEEPTKTS